jgi:hypothetical protein
MSMKPKAALVKDGFLPPGSEKARGRMSAAGIKRCEELAAKGWLIEGFAIGKPSADTSKPVTVERVKPEAGRMLDVPDMRRSEEEWSASVMVDGKSRPVGFRTVCNGCGNSLGWCYEESSRVWVDHNHEAVVRFTPKRG